MTDDSELLRRFCHESSEEAFAELVERHLGLVYHTALRTCGGDSHRAEDVSQEVFTRLARQAKALVGRPSVAGWLHRCTRNAAAQAVRTEVRRQMRELAAQPVGLKSMEDSDDVTWERLKPEIDAGLETLAARDGQAIILRFFEGRTFAEIGAQFSITEAAARMRVERALVKMRAALTRRGIVSTTAALGFVLASNAAGAPPTGLAASIATGVLAGTTAGSASGAALFMSMTKLQFIAACAVLLGGSTALVWQYNANKRLKSEVARLEEATRESRPSSGHGGTAPVVVAASTAQPVGPSRPGPAMDPPRTPTALAPGLMPVESLGNAGRATARSAFATQLWAARTGNIKLEASTLLLSADERQKLQALLQTLSPEFQAQYKTPEDLLAFALAGSPRPVAGMEILGEIDLGPDDVTLQTAWQHEGDSFVHHNDALLHQEAGGWKLVVPPGMVTLAIGYLSRQ